MRGRLALLGLVIALATGCRIDDTRFVSPGDDGGGGAGDGGPTDAAIDGPIGGPRILVTPDTLTVPEGDQVTVRVSLSAAPAADTMITVDPIDDARVGAAPASLTFTPGNWNVERVVTLMAASDDDAADNPVTVRFDGGGVVGDGSAVVRITDDDLMRLLVTPATSLSVTEQQGAPVQVRLSARPAGAVEVAVAAVSAGVVTLSAPTLTFSEQTWNQPQTVTVTGADDLDTVDSQTQLTFDPDVDGISTHVLAVTVTDDDVLNLQANPSNLGTIVEGGAGAPTFQVRLTQAPAGTVTVSVSAAPAGAVGLSQSTLTFTPANWSTTQPVTVAALQDGNVVDEAVTITLSAPGLTSRVVTAMVDDDDTQVIEVAPVAITSLTEGTGANLAVHLRYQPAATTVLQVSSLDPSLAAVDLDTLTFTTATWDVDQVVRVSAVPDPDLAGGSTAVRLNDAGAGLSRDVPVTVADDDVQALVLDTTDLAIGEGGSATVRARLAFQPAGTLSVSVTSGLPAKIGAAPDTLTFTPTSYATDQLVTISGLEDADTANEAGTVTLASPGLTSRAVTVRIADNDALDLVVMPATLTVPEGMAAPLMVKLGAQPPGAVMVSIVANPTGVVGLDRTTLSFDGATWNSFQTVSVSAGQDADIADESTTLTLSAPGLAPRSVPVTVDDDDVLTATASPSPVGVTEGQSVVVDVRLSHDPGGTVNVGAAVLGGASLDVSPASLTFTSADWNSRHDLTLTGLPDDDNLGGPATVRLTVPGGATTDLTANLTDTTVVLGFPPPHPGPARGAGIRLHAYREPTEVALYSCFTIEKLIVQVSSLGLGQPLIRVGVYGTGMADTPAGLIWADQPRDLRVGTNTFAIGTQIPVSFPIWLSVETTGTPQLATKAGAVPHCARAHAFGDGPPSPFDATVLGAALHRAVPAAGPTCDVEAPPAIWLVGRPSPLCVINE